MQARQYLSSAYRHAKDKCTMWVSSVHTILLKGTQVEFKDPNEYDTFLKSSWWEDSDERGIEIIHRAP